MQIYARPAVFDEADKTTEYFRKDPKSADGYVSIGTFLSKEEASEASKTTKSFFPSLPSFLSGKTIDTSVYIFTQGRETAPYKIYNVSPATVENFVSGDSTKNYFRRLNNGTYHMLGTLLEISGDTIQRASFSYDKHGLVSKFHKRNILVDYALFYEDAPGPGTGTGTGTGTGPGTGPGDKRRRFSRMSRKRSGKRRRNNRKSKRRRSSRR